MRVNSGRIGKNDVIEQASRAINVLIGIVESLLDVTRFESGKMPLSLSQCDLKALVEEALETLGPSSISMIYILNLRSILYQLSVIRS